MLSSQKHDARGRRTSNLAPAPTLLQARPFGGLASAAAQAQAQMKLAKPPNPAAAGPAVGLAKPPQPPAAHSVQLPPQRRPGSQPPVAHTLSGGRAQVLQSGRYGSRTPSPEHHHLDLGSPMIARPMAASPLNSPCPSGSPSPATSRQHTPEPGFQPRYRIAACSPSPQRQLEYGKQFVPQFFPQQQQQQQCSGAGGSMAVTVIAPGAGTGINGAIYNELGRMPDFNLEIVGQSRAPYDRYPPVWPEGSPAPNLESFARDVVEQRVVERSDCLVVGSRGGQVVLPRLWEAFGDRTPPAVVINGGCAMGLPTPVHWPQTAVSFLLLGGQDYFKGNFTSEEYIADTKRHLPAKSSTTAILYVREMQHMPQAPLLGLVLPLMLRALAAWQGPPGTAPGARAVPQAELQAIRDALQRAGCWSGRLLWTTGPGVWQDAKFGSEPAKKSRITSSRGGA